MARRATAIAQQRQAHANVLLVDAGNTLFGQPLADNSQGKVSIEAMNALGYQAMGLGDVDIRNGTSLLAERAKEASFPFLTANLLDSSTGQPLGQAYTLVTYEGRKVALIGLSRIAGTLPKDIQEKVTEKDYLNAARAAVDQAKKETNAIVVLSTLGLERERTLAREVPGITLIVGGGRDGGRTEIPLRVEGTDTYIVRTIGNGEELGAWTLTIDPNGKAASIAGELLVLSQDAYAEDPDMLSLIKRYQPSP